MTVNLTELARLFSLEGRVALITGGSRGAGRGIALALASRGAAVAVNYRRDEAAARETVAQIEALGSPAVAVQADIAAVETVPTLVEAAAAALGPIDILVNNAGVASRGQLVADTDPAELQRLFGPHVFGAFACCKAVLPAMRQRPRGDIIFISSVLARDALPGGAPYNMAKAAMESLAMTLMKEEQRHNIRVNVVGPGLIESDMGERLMRARGVDDLVEFRAEMPFGHICTPEDVGQLTAFLVSEAGGYINGQVIGLHGGGETALKGPPTKG